jgi:phosphoribosylformimino-5-aminoimidazole carboxamide ribotide isomerase
MIVIPAIDLKEGRCVRLSQGRMDQESIYSEDPVQMAMHWEGKGAERLHVVDLNGALTGRPYHFSLIEKLVRSVHIPVQVGGGIRQRKTIEDYLSMGVRWIILGTSALKNQTLLEEALLHFPDQVILAIDSRGGKVAVEGWSEMAEVEAIDFAKRFEGTGVSSIIFTDIERDGMATGLNLEMTKALAQSTSIPVIASGGVSRKEDIEHLQELESDGVIGVIIGRALYTGQVDLEEAIRLAKRGKI